MTADRAYAERHGMTLREFQRVMLTAQRKLMRGEPLTEIERRVWRFAMEGIEED